MTLTTAAVTKSESSAKETLTLEAALGLFLRALEGKNRSPSTVRAYETDVGQLIAWLHENTIVVEAPGQVEKADINEFLSHLGKQELSGVTRARKLAALREYFPCNETPGGAESAWPRREGRHRKGWLVYGC